MNSGLLMKGKSFSMPDPEHHKPSTPQLDAPLKVVRARNRKTLNPNP